MNKTKDLVERPRPWNFGQFEEKILETALELLNRDRRIKNVRKGHQKLSDPVWLSRIISAVVKSDDDRGILTGRWPPPPYENPYEGGKAPLTWSGSVKIIQQYAESGVPVKYGQSGLEIVR